MNRLVSLFYVLTVVAYFGSALGNEDTNGTRNCPLEDITGEEENMETLKELATILARCLNQSGTDLNTLGSVKTLEDHRRFFKQLCHGLPDTKEYLAVESLQWNRCYNSTMGNVFTIFFDLVKASLQKGCENEGESLAVFIDGFHRHTKNYRASNPFVLQCILNSSTRLKVVTKSKANLSTKIWFFYRELQRFKECYAEYIHEDSLVAVSVEHMNEVFGEMKCLNQENESLVVCKSIDENTIDRASVCPLKSKEGDHSLDMMLGLRLNRCFIVYEPYSPQLSNLTTIEEFRGYFNNYCHRYNRVCHCLNETIMVSSLCLHDDQYKTFELVYQYLNNALEAGCFEGGKRLVNMFHMAKTLEGNSDKRDVLMKCLSQAEKAQTFGEPSSLYQFYLTLPGVRQCLVNTASADTVFVSDVTGFMNDIISKMKCINPEDGSIVLCDTIEK